jgi:hypothetical protein
MLSTRKRVGVSSRLAHPLLQSPVAHRVMSTKQMQGAVLTSEGRWGVMEGAKWSEFVGLLVDHAGLPREAVADVSRLYENGLPP